MSEGNDDCAIKTTSMKKVDGKSSSSTKKCDK